MPKDYKNRTSKKTPKRKSKSRKKKSNATRVSKDDNGRQIPWKAVLLLVVVVLVVYAAFSLLNHYTRHARPKKISVAKTNGIPVITAKPVTLSQAIAAKAKRQKQIKYSAQVVHVNRPVQFVFQNASLSSQKIKSNNITLQLGVYTKDSSELYRLKRKLMKHQFKASITIFYRAGKALYHVQMGPYKTQVQAEQVQKKLEEIKIYSLIKG